VSMIGRFAFMRKHHSQIRTGFSPGALVVAYYVLGVPLAAYGMITLGKLSHRLAASNLLSFSNLLGFGSICGLFAIIWVFLAGRRWVREKDQQIAQRGRDRRAVQIYDWLTSGKPGQQVMPYSLYLRPFTSTGHVRIPLGSTVHKRVGAELGPGPIDPELGRTSRLKRYVTFGDLETVIAGLVEAHAPLIGFGRTGEQLGAGRIESDDEHWRVRFELLAAHAAVIFLLPSTHDGTRWEIERILGDTALLRKTALFVPPNDTVLGAGFHLEIGAVKGPIGGFDLREDAIKALAKLVPQAPIARIKEDKWGALLRLTRRRRVKYTALRMEKGPPLKPFNLGSNLRLDRVHLRREVQAILRDLRLLQTRSTQPTPPLLTRIRHRFNSDRGNEK
jgi:hypothetical protein